MTKQILHDCGYHYCLRSLCVTMIGWHKSTRMAVCDWLRWWVLCTRVHHTTSLNLKSVHLFSVTSWKLALMHDSLYSKISKTLSFKNNLVGIGFISRLVTCSRCSLFTNKDICVIYGSQWTVVNNCIAQYNIVMQQKWLNVIN